jgi:hypothetical protein
MRAVRGDKAFVDRYDVVVRRPTLKDTRFCIGGVLLDNKSGALTIPYHSRE